MHDFIYCSLYLCDQRHDIPEPLVLGIQSLNLKRFSVQNRSPLRALSAHYTVLSPQEDTTQELEYQTTEHHEPKETQPKWTNWTFKLRLLLNLTHRLAHLALLLLPEFQVGFPLLGCLRHDGCVSWSVSLKAWGFARRGEW